MELSNRLSRRTALAASGTVALSAYLAPVSPAGAVGHRKRDRDTQRQIEKVLLGRDSTNGWAMERGTDIGGSIWTRPLAGTGGSVAIRLGDVEAVLFRVARRFHYEVAALEPGDVVGYQRPRRLGPGVESNHASGTAIDVLPGGLPSGVRSLSHDQTDTIRAIVRACDGVVAWGGEGLVPAEAHFHIAVGPEDPRLPALASRIRIEDELPPSDVGITM